MLNFLKPEFDVGVQYGPGNSAGECVDEFKPNIIDFKCIILAIDVVLRGYCIVRESWILNEILIWESKWIFKKSQGAMEKTKGTFCQRFSNTNRQITRLFVSLLFSVVCYVVDHISDLISKVI